MYIVYFTVATRFDLILPSSDLQCKLKNKNQLDATYYFLVLLICSTCFGYHYAHHQELTTTLVISFSKEV